MSPVITLSRSQRPHAIELAGSPSARRFCAREARKTCGGGIVAPPRPAEDTRHRREEDEAGEVSLHGQLMQAPRGVDLGGKDLIDLLRRERLDRSVGERAGAMDDCSKGVLA